MKKLRLLMFEKCNRRCEGCCNKDWDLDALPTISDYSEFDMVMLTGGEPLLDCELLCKTIDNIQAQSNAIVIVYTAMIRDLNAFCRVLAKVNGITLTLHEQCDVDDFDMLCEKIKPKDVVGKSMRLNVFEDVKTRSIPGYWKIKRVKWIKNCPLPEGEVLMRLSSPS